MPTKVIYHTNRLKGGKLVIILKAFAFLTQSFTKLDTSSLTNGVPQKSMANMSLLMEESPGGTSQAVQWLGLHTSTAGGPGSIPGWELRSRMLQHGQKKSILAKSRKQLPCPDCHGVLEFQPSQEPGAGRKEPHSRQ